MFSTIKKVIDLIDAGRKFIAKTFEKVKEWSRRRRARNIRSAVDDDDIDAINKFVSDIERKKQDREDSS